MHKHKAFTLVELLIVIVIIAILAAISIVAYNGIQQRAHNAEMIQDVSNWMKTLHLSYITNGTISVPPTPGYSTLCLGLESQYPPDNGMASGQCYVNGHTSDVLMDSIEEVSNIGGATLYTNSETYGGMRGMHYGGQYGTYNIWYRLLGADQDCGLASVVETVNLAGNLTSCRIDVIKAIGGSPIDII